MEQYQALRSAAERITTELIACAHLKAGQILVVGCSTSEVLGDRIGSASSPEAGRALAEGVMAALDRAGIYLAAQCCEHLNRAIVIERAAVPYADPVNVLPRPKAGGSFPTAAYALMRDPVVVEHIRADAGLDIGGTLIGMHLKEVAVPLRLSENRLGDAILLCARTRPRFIGGVRAEYNPDLL